MKDNFFEEAQKRLDIIASMDALSATAQLIGYLKFLEAVPEVKVILGNLLADKTVEVALNMSSIQMPPKLKTLEEVASACVFMLELVRQKNDCTILFSLGIRDYSGHDFAAISREFTNRYLQPFLSYLSLSLNPGDIVEEFECRLTTLRWTPQFQEVSFRVVGLWEWLNTNQATKTIIESILSNSQAEKILAVANYNSPPQTESPDDIIAVGVFLMQECAKGVEIASLGHKYGIRAWFLSSRIQDTSDAIMERFIMPAVNYVEEELKSSICKSEGAFEQLFETCQDIVPSEIHDSLSRFRKDHPEPTAFIMMQFSDTPAHNAIVSAIKTTLTNIGITALRADDHQYHDDVLPNVKTYMHGCKFGIAVFERIENDVFNPNVSLEVGYMLAIGKNICYLKDKTLRRLPTDLISKLYREFDTHAIEATLPKPLTKWLQEKDIC